MINHAFMKIIKPLQKGRRPSSVVRRPSSVVRHPSSSHVVRHFRRRPSSSVVDIVRNAFQVLSKEYFLKRNVRVLSKGFLNMFRTCLNYSSRFPEKVQKEEIQQ